MLVDNAAMRLVSDPKHFDVLLTENMFGDIKQSSFVVYTGPPTQSSATTQPRGRIRCIASRAKAANAASMATAVPAAPGSPAAAEPTTVSPKATTLTTAVIASRTRGEPAGPAAAR